MAHVTSHHAKEPRGNSVSRLAKKTFMSNSTLVMRKLEIRMNLLMDK